MITLAGHSAWTFDTSATGGVGLELVAIQGGKIWLNDPRKNSVPLHLAAAGVGLSYGYKIPKFGKLPVPKVGGKSVGGAVGPKFFPSGGLIWKTTACPRPELTHDDFCGPVVFIEGGASLIALAGAADIMLLGFDKLAYAEALAAGGTPILGDLMRDHALSTVKAVMACYGTSATFGAQVGFAVMTGAVW